MYNNSIPVIEFEKVTKIYSQSDSPALVECSFKIFKGDKIGIIGANGSGKSTMLKLLMDYIKPEEGKILINGNGNLEEAKKHIGYVSENQEGMESFTPRELFLSASKFLGLAKRQAENRVNELLKFSDLEIVSNNLLEGFSKGMVQRTFISLSILHNPNILLLDEPMSGLDPQAQIEVRTLLQKLNDYTVLYASHNLQEIEDFTSKVFFIQNGSILKILDLKNLESEIYVIDLEPFSESLLNNINFLNPEIILRDSRVTRLQFSGTTYLFQKFIDTCKKKGIRIHRIRSKSILEKYYTQYVKS
jgi:ABC-2 type transport system ATP-binding protein